MRQFIISFILLSILLALLIFFEDKPSYAQEYRELKSLTAAEGKLVKRFTVRRNKDSGSEKLLLSPDGFHAVYTASMKDSQGVYIQIDDWHNAVHKYVNLSSQPFSNDGSSVIYSHGDQENISMQTQDLFRNKKIFKTFKNDFQVKLSPLGNDYIYVETAESKQETDVSDKQYYVMTKNKKFGPFSYVETYGFNNDGTLFGYAARRNSEDYVVQVNDKEYEVKGSIYQLIFSDSGANFGFSHYKRDENRTTYYSSINGKPLKTFDERMYLYFSRDGSSYCFTDEERSTFYHENKWLGPYNSASKPVLSNDGKTFAFYYKAKSGSDTVSNFSGSTGQACADVKYCCTFSWLKIFTPREMRFIPGESYYIQYNSQQSGPYDNMLEPVFSPDGNNIAFYYKREDGSQPLYDENEGRAVMTKIYRSFLFYNGREQEITGVSELGVDRYGITEDRRKYCLADDDHILKFINISGKTYGPFRALDFKIAGNTIYVAAATGDNIEIVRF